MAFLPTEENGLVYEHFVALYRSLKHDGEAIPKSEIVPGQDYTYVSDGPRTILEVDEYGKFGLPDTGGPITGGWLRRSATAFRGGSDGVRALADYRESELRRWQKRRGRKHPA